MNRVLKMKLEANKQTVGAQTAGIWRTEEKGSRLASRTGAIGRARKKVKATAMVKVARLKPTRGRNPVSAYSIGPRLVAEPRPTMVKTVNREIAAAMFCGDSTLLAKVTQAVE